MSCFSSKREQALEACDKVINGIEDGTISVSSSLLLCKKIARLVNDLEGQEWLGYEYGGYPSEKGRIPQDAWKIGAKHRRTYREKDKDGKSSEYMFTELCGELESSIESKMKALGNYTTQGFSASGDFSVGATNSMAHAVAISTNSLLQGIKREERYLSILLNQIGKTRAFFCNAKTDCRLCHFLLQRFAYLKP